jgi:hypothetical protein
MTHPESEAELILLGGTIRTLDPVQPLAGSLAIGGGRILLAADGSEALRLKGPRTRVVDLQGRMAMPGLIDFHIHLFMGAAGRLYEEALTPAMDFAEVLDCVGRAVATPGRRQWIVAGPFGPPAERGMRDLTALEQLDAVSAGRPVVLSHISGHARFANSRALELAGIGVGTADPPHGEIVRDQRTGRPTGYLIETASTLVRRAIPPLTAQESIAAARHGVAMLNRLGITGFFDAIASTGMMEAFKALDDKGELDAWASFCLPAVDTLGGPAWSDAMIDERAALCGPHMSAEFGKVFLDGVPSLRTAAMIDAYAPRGDGTDGKDRGEPLLSLDELTAHISAFDRRGMGMKVHATGDRAIRMMLDAVESVRRLNGPAGPAHQLSHGNFILPEDVQRLARLNVIADLNPPLWFPSPTSQAQERAVGAPRFAGAWPIRDIVASGAMAAAGTDWPAISAAPNPWPSLAGMISRRDASGRTPGIHRPDQALDLEVALPLYTRNAAAGMGRGGIAGMLAAGRSADIVILGRDLFGMSPEDIAAVEPVATLFEGRLVHGDL